MVGPGTSRRPCGLQSAAGGPWRFADCRKGNPGGTGGAQGALRGMRSSYNSAVVVLHGDPADPIVKQASALLDQSGLSYVTKAAGPGASSATRSDDPRGVRVSWGADSVSVFSRRELVDFLWAHGAKFEDS